MNKQKAGTPLFCDLVISGRCFFKCKMCQFWKAPPDTEMLSYDECKKFVDNLAEFIDYKLDINVLGGEPFMVDWLLPVCNYIHHKGFQSIVSTNAYLIDEEMAKKIGDSHLGILAISLDGIKAETHNSIRGKIDAYSKVIDALGYLKKYRNDSLHITILSLILRENLEELPELVKWAKESGVVNSISFLALVESGLVTNKKEWFKQAEYNQLWPQDFYKVTEVMNSLISLKKEGHSIANPLNQLEAFKGYYDNPETFLKETKYCIHDYVIDIDHTGAIFLSGHLIGSIKNNTPIKELWFSEDANKIREYIDLHGCDSARSCPINFICAFNQELDGIK